MIDSQRTTDGKYPLFELREICAQLPINEFFRDLNIRVDRGEFVAVISARTYDLENMIDLMNGKVDVTNGQVLIDGKPYSPRKLRQPVIPVVIRETSLIPNITIAQNIFIHRFYSKRKCEELARNQFVSFGLDVDLSKRVDELSIGEQKLVDIFKQYNSSLDLIVLYDTLNFIEQQHIPRLKEIFARFRREGKGLMFLTNNLEDALYFSDRIYLIGNGRVVSEYETEAIRENPRQLLYLMSGLDYGYLEKQEENAVLDTILKTRDTLTSSSEMKETLRQLAENIAKVLHAKGCAICVGDVGEGEELNIAAVTEQFDREILSELKQAVEDSLTDQSLQDGILKNGPLVIMPVFSKEKRVGFIVLLFAGEPELGKDEAFYIRAFAQEAALTIETSRLMGRSVLLQESHHRIKNNLQAIVNLLYMQRSSLPAQEKEAFRPILNDIINRIKSIALVHDLLSTDGPRNSVVDLKDIISRIARFYSMGNISITLSLESIMIPYNKATSIALIVNELLTTCIKHAFPADMDNKTIAITSKRSGNYISLTVQDNGVGISSDKPNEGRGGLGNRIIEIIMQQFEGDIHYYNESGTRILLNFPIEKVFEM